MLSDETTPDGRTLRFRLRSPRKAEYVNLFFNLDAGIISARLNEKTISVEGATGNWWRWRYFALPPEGITVELTVETPEPVAFKVTEVAYDWPEALVNDLPTSPADRMRMPYGYSDSSVITRTFQLAMAANPEPKPEPEL